MDPVSTTIDTTDSIPGIILSLHSQAIMTPKTITIFLTILGLLLLEGQWTVEVVDRQQS